MFHGQIPYREIVDGLNLKGEARWSRFFVHCSPVTSLEGGDLPSPEHHSSPAPSLNTPVTLTLLQMASNMASEGDSESPWSKDKAAKFEKYAWRRVPSRSPSFAFPSLSP
jgi:hypothetical protein